MTNNYKQCTNCILDIHDDPDIVFDEKGVCNYCNNYYNTYVRGRKTPEELAAQLKSKVAEIKGAKVGKYDSIMGLSGGVDSSYLAYEAKALGLNPLIVHFDNGWNSELAVKNIENIINHTGFDLFTYVVDWEEFRDLQLAYIRSSVLDWEIPSDHGFFATLYKQAAKNKIKYILTGHNHQTEAILPKTMRWSKMDVANIRDIHKKFGTRPLKTFPIMGFFEFSWYQLVKRIERVNVLEYLPYNKHDAKKTIVKEFGWRDYGGKHYESIFTRFYQGYVLKEKFGFDKRKAHLSNLICSGQITREMALEEISRPAYDEDQLRDDIQYVLKKLGLSAEEFSRIMNEKKREHTEFDSYETGLYRSHEKFMRRIAPFSRVLKKYLT